VTLEPRDERRHQPGPEPAWSEWWALDYARDDGFGGFVRCALFPNAKRAWFWAYVVVPGFAGPIVVRDHEVTLPRGDVLELRAEGLWTEATCETPFEHWSYGLEAFAVLLDDPDDAYRGEIGERLPLGFDLEWEVDAPRVAQRDRYHQDGIVHGEVLYGRERVAFAGRGRRAHGWGTEPWRDATEQPVAGAIVLARAEVPLDGPLGDDRGLTRALCRLDQHIDEERLQWVEWVHD
jgi:hypothetical protein